MHAWTLSTRIYLMLTIVFVSFGTCSKLKMRVRSGDGLIVEEILEADSENDAITVEFKQRDGTHITVTFDFKRDMRIIRALILGEPERGQNHYQVLCFLTRLDRYEIISSESLARLRQKNTHSVRTAEEERGVEHLHMDVEVTPSHAGDLSTHLHPACEEARGGVYTRTADVKHWLGKGLEEAAAFEPLPQTADSAAVPRCPSSLDLWQPCVCRYSLQLEWLPCLLKYCHSRRRTDGKGSPHKCGIRSCSKGYRFDYYVPHRRLCPWDEKT